MNDDIIYSDEEEARIIRVSDVIPTIEETIGLQVVEIKPVKQREDVNSEYNVLRFPGTKPIALWWFSARFESPEGKRVGMLQVALEEQGFRVISFDHPRLLFFSETLRDRAKAEAPACTREYIDQLEQALADAHLLWKTANEYTKDIADLRNVVYAFHLEFRKVGYLLPDAKGGGPQGLGMRKVFLPDWAAKFPDQYITGDDELG